MIQLKIIICIGICFLGIIEYTQGADEYTDENRPYEFGFTIDGEQHRHEKKDKNGIIMGEFGFITADGVYHVTVYATDENGRFKILSMKNIRVKPYPTASSVKKGHSLPFPPSKSAPELQGPQTRDERKPNKPLSASPTKSCSHCSIPTTTTTTKAPQLSDIAVVASNPQIPSRPGLTTSQSGLTPQNNPNYSQNYPQQSDSGIVQPQNASANIPQIGSRVGQDGLQNFEISDSTEGSRIHHNNQQNLQENQEVRDRQIYSPHPNNINTNNGQSEIVTNSQYPQQGYSPIQNKPQQQTGINEYNPQNINTMTGMDNYSQQGIANPNNYPKQQGDMYQNNLPPKDGSKDKNYLQQVSSLSQSQSPSTTDSDQHRPETTISTQQAPNQQDSNSRVPKQYSDITGTNQPQGFKNVIANKPTLIAAQMQIVPKETDIHHREPGEQEGLPDGVSKDDVTHLLYTFNYTVGFHGHHEEGYSNGAKQGYYYVTGRNGIRIRVDYVADEKGFRPRISQIALDLLSDDVPKPETEKDEKFGLKGYEFKWLYYPADEKPQ